MAVGASSQSNVIQPRQNQAEVQEQGELKKENIRTKDTFQK